MRRSEVHGSSGRRSSAWRSPARRARRSRAPASRASPSSRCRHRDPTTPTPKTAGRCRRRRSAAVAGKPPTGGGSFALKLSKDAVPTIPPKPGFGDGDYVLEIESSGTPTETSSASPISAAYFITLTISLGKCTIHDLALRPERSGPSCDGATQPNCARPDQAGKCSATIYAGRGQRAGERGLVANQPFGARFSVRSNPTPANCQTGDLFVNRELSRLRPARAGPERSLGVGGVALGTSELRVARARGLRAEPPRFRTRAAPAARAASGRRSPRPRRRPPSIAAIAQLHQRIVGVRPHHRIRRLEEPAAGRSTARASPAPPRRHVTWRWSGGDALLQRGDERRDARRAVEVGGRRWRPARAGRPTHSVGKRRRPPPVDGGSDRLILGRPLRADRRERLLRRQRDRRVAFVDGDVGQALDGLGAGADAGTSHDAADADGEPRVGERRLDRARVPRSSPIAPSPRSASARTSSSASAAARSSGGTAAGVRPPAGPRPPSAIARPAARG